MFVLKKIGCRLFQAAFRLALPFLPYREPQVVASCEELKAVFRGEKSACVLIVTDEGILRHGLTASVEQVLNECEIPYGIYDKTQPNPTVENVEEALKLYHSLHCDTLVALGGGSAMDCAKALGARVVYPRRTLAQMGGVMRILRRLPTLIAIPTTAGTGSETTLAAVISDSKTHHKYALMSFPLIPHYAVLDPKMTLSLPPHLTATTGLDALTHAVEAYIGRSTTKETRRLATEAVATVFQNVKTAYSDGQNQSARKEMLWGAYQAGIAFSKSYVGYVHAIAHSLGGKYGTPHGLANGVLLPLVLAEYGPCIDRKLHRLGVAAGVCDAADSPKVGAEKFIAALRELNREMNLPTTLPEVQIQDIPALAKHAEREANPLYPVPKLMTAKELEKFYFAVANPAETSPET